MFGGWGALSRNIYVNTTERCDAKPTKTDQKDIKKEPEEPKGHQKGSQREAKRTQKAPAKAGTGTPKKGLPVPTPTGTKKAPNGDQIITRGTKRTKGLEGGVSETRVPDTPPSPGAKNIQKALKGIQKGAKGVKW